MARPKKLIDPTRLNLVMNGKAKRRAAKLAFDRRISIGQLLDELVDAELARNGRAK